VAADNRRPPGVVLSTIWSKCDPRFAETHLDVRVRVKQSYNQRKASTPPVNINVGGSVQRRCAYQNSAIREFERSLYRVILICTEFQTDAF